MSNSGEKMPSIEQLKGVKQPRQMALYNLPKSATKRASTLRKSWNSG
jgi:hypothetical protein